MPEPEPTQPFGKDDALTLFLFGVAGPIIGMAYWGLFTQGIEGLLVPLLIPFFVVIIPQAGVPMVALMGIVPALTAGLADIIARRRYEFWRALAVTAAVGVLAECAVLTGIGIGLETSLILSALATALSCALLADWVRKQARIEAATH